MTYVEEQEKVINILKYHYENLSNGYLPCPISFIIEETNFSEYKVRKHLKKLRTMGFCKMVRYTRKENDDPRLNTYVGYFLN